MPKFRNEVLNYIPYNIRVFRDEDSDTNFTEEVLIRGVQVQKFRHKVQMQISDKRFRYEVFRFRGSDTNFT